MDYPDIVLPRLRFKYCPMCRSELTKRVLNDDDIERMVCPTCGWVHFPANAMGVVVLITTEDGIVAIREDLQYRSFSADRPRSRRQQKNAGALLAEA